MKTYMCSLIIVVLLTWPVSAQIEPVVVPSSSSPAPIQREGAYGAPVSSPNLMRTQFLGRHEEEPTVFIIPAADEEGQDLGPILEDLRVMCRIFDKMHSTGMGNLPVLGLLGDDNAQRAEALYLQGYGVVFFLKVPFILDLSEPEGKIEVEDCPGIDPVWQSVKDETLYGNQRSPNARNTEQTNAMNRAATILTTERLLRTLKHASNIRTLKPDEKIIIRITGEGNSGVHSGRSKRPRRTAGYGNMGPYGGVGNAPYGGDPFTAEVSCGPTTLIARTTKADVDDYSNGKLTFDEFAGKTKVIGIDAHNVTPVTIPTR